MKVQRLRNLTTGKLHTDMSCVYEDIEYITGLRVFTHQIPDILDAIRPWLKEQVVTKSFWDGVYNPNLIGEYDIQPMTEQEKTKYLKVKLI